MTVRLHFRAEIKDANGKRILVLRSTDLYNRFLQHARREAASAGATGGTLVVTATEWGKTSQTFDL